MQTLIIAHRGASSLAPENTFAAFDRALAGGADGIEFDLQLSKDNYPVVIHDENLERTTTGQGMVRDYDLADLKSFDAGSWFAAEFSGERIPTLDQLFKRYENSKLLFNLELKTSMTDNQGLEEAVLKCVAEFNLEKRVVISSFNHQSLVRCKELNPHIRTGMLYFEELESPWERALSLGCYSAHPFFYYLQEAEVIEGFKNHNLPVYTWTVNDPEQMEYLVKNEIDAIITDYPQVLSEIITKAG